MPTVFQLAIILALVQLSLLQNIIYQNDGHAGAFGGIGHYQGVLYTGGQDNTIRRWNATDGRLIATLLPDINYRAWFNSFLIMKDKLVTAGRSGKIIVWDLPELSIMTTISTPDSTEMMIKLNDSFFMASHWSSQVALYSADTWSRVAIASAFQVASMVLYDSNVLITGGKDGMVRWWDLNTLTQIQQ